MAIILGNNLRNKLIGTNAIDTISGFGGNDILDGSRGNDTLRGGGGNDTLIGGLGNDKLYGAAGNDTLRGDAGADRLDGGGGTDTVTYAAVTGSEVAELALDGSFASAGAAAGDTFFSIENVIGTKNSDMITGNGAANVITGGAGNDLLAGQGGADRLIGGDGDDSLAPGDDTSADIIDGGAGFDSVYYLTSTVGVVVNLESGLAGGGATNDTYISIENAVGSNTANDTLTAGRSGFVYGAGGDDILSGSTVTGGIMPYTTEVLQGDSGADTFVLHYGTGFDIIADFAFADGDKFRVSDAEFALGGLGPVNLKNAASGDVVADLAGPEFIWDFIGSNLYYDADGTGVVYTPTQIAKFIGYTSSLFITDFVVVA